jgi:hypothetical protein
MRIARGGAAALVVGSLLSALAAPAAAVTRGSSVDPIHETFSDVGCDATAPEEITVVGVARESFLVTDGLFRIQGSFTATHSWTETETGEAFLGRASGSFSFLELPAGTDVFTDVFTGVARGDQGTTALFASRFHITVGTDGSVRAEYVRLWTSCR